MRTEAKLSKKKPEAVAGTLGPKRERKLSRRKAYLPGHHGITAQRHLNLALYNWRMYPEVPCQFGGLGIELRRLVDRDNLRSLVVRLSADSEVGQALQAWLNDHPIALPGAPGRILQCIVTLEKVPEPTVDEQYRLKLRPSPAGLPSL